MSGIAETAAIASVERPDQVPKIALNCLVASLLPGRR